MKQGPARESTKRFTSLGALRGFGMFRIVGGDAGSNTVGLIWSLAFPIIKLLWTSSFVLVTGGISFLLMAHF